jgi:hypothetical protein
MKFTKFLLLACTFAAAFATQGLAQVSWNNQSPAGISDDIWCVTYGNGTYAAVTSQGKLLTSPDGLTWSSQTIDSGVLLVSIAYGNGTWVVVGAGGTILVSTDLKNWLTAKAVTTNQLNGVLYNGTFWASVGDSATVITSTDALNWTVQAVPAGVTGFLHGITIPSGNFGFYVSGAVTGNGTGPDNAGVLLGISGGPNVPGGTTYSVNLIGEGNNLAQGGMVGNLEAILTTANTSPTVAVGWDTVMSGQPGNDGFRMSAAPNVIYRGLAYGNGYWVAAGEQGTILSSKDRNSWTQRFSGDSPSTLSTATLLSATYSSTLQRFVIVGTAGTILVSNSAPTVFGNVSTRGYVSSTETFIGGFVIQGTSPRTVLIRGDGPVLSTFSVPSPLPDPVVTVYNRTGGVVATNTGWGTNTNPAALSIAALEVGAFALPSSSADSALLLTLPPGAYTVQVTSAGNNSGIALFEAYTD